MLKQPRESREQQRQREISEFIDGWNWGSLFRNWKRRVEEFNVELDPLFQTISVYDPANPSGRNTELAWWPANSIHRLRKEFQEHLDKWPGTRGPVHPVISDAGPIRTLDYLWQNKEPEKVAAILIAGSIFSRVESGRACFPVNHWPRQPFVYILADWVYAKWQGPEQGNAWHHLCTRALPTNNDDYVYKIDTMEALIRYLAEEHASLLLNYCPVAIEFTSTRSSFAKALG
ncbi:MAG TPA: hypothetical protein VFK88_02485 [Gallionella sp.]|nr:hypothetical protein [Gallionella sp.]